MQFFAHLSHAGDELVFDEGVDILGAPDDERPETEAASAGERLFERGVCLPSGTAMDEEQQAAVIQTIIKLFEGRG